MLIHAATEKPAKIALWIIGVLLVLPLLGTGAGILLRDRHFYPPPPEARFPPAANVTEARLQDLQYLREYVNGYDRSFSPQARQQALALIGMTEAGARDLSPAAFEMKVSEVVALAQNGHSNVWSGSRSRRYSRLPVRAYWFDDGFYIVRARRGLASLIGAEITAIGNQAVRALYPRLKRLYGGPDEGFQANALPALLENADFLYELGVIPNPAEVPVAIRQGGESRSVTLVADPPNPDAPLAWTWELLQGNELDRLLIVDLRLNGGGDYTRTAGIMEWLAIEMPDDGRIYAITGRHTFSAAINNVAFLKAYDGDKVTIIGQRIGDSAAAWGETNDFILPNSGIGITASRGYHDVANGCHDWDKCYWADFFHNVAAGKLDPDIPVPFNFASFKNGDDAVLQTILALESSQTYPIALVTTP